MKQYRPLLLAALLGAGLLTSCRDFDPQAAVPGSGGSTAGSATNNGAGKSGNTSAGSQAQAGSTDNGAAGEGGAASGGAAGAAPGSESGAGAGEASSDAGAGAGGIGELEPLPPNHFPGLSLWLEASPEDCAVDAEGRVSEWHDKSGNANDGVQAALDSQPKLAAGVLNGHDVIAFTSHPKAGDTDQPSSLWATDSPSLWVATEDFSYLFVGRWRNDPTPVISPPSARIYSGSGGILTKQELTPPYRGVALFANYPAIFVNSPASTYFTVQLELGGGFAFSYSDHLNDDVFRLVAVQRIGTDLGIRINGVREGGTRVSETLDLSARDGPLVIGGWGGQPLIGDLAEVMIIRGMMSPLEVSGLERFLLDKYAIE